MNVVVAGMGEVGTHIVRVLVREKHNVTIIDERQTALDRAEEMFDAITVRGHAGSAAALRAAGIASADLFVAVTDQTEVNLVAAIEARNLGAKRTIARALAPAYFEAERGLWPNMLGIDLVINPIFQIASDLRRIVRSASAVAVHDFADHQIETVHLQVQAHSRAAGKALREVKLPPDTLVAAILREKELIIPTGTDKLNAGDEIVVVGRTERILEIEQMFVRKRVRFGRKAIIVGGGQIGLSLARSLEEDEFNVVIIERDRGRCETLSRELQRSVVLHGEGTNAALLEEEGVSSADVFITVSDEDELNLMASLLARDLGAQRCISLVHKPDYAHVCERLGINSTLSPRLTVAEQVLKYVREGQIVSITPILEGRAEFLEFLVAASSPISNQRLQDVALPRGAVVAAVLGSLGALVPSGGAIVRPGDQVVVFAVSGARAGVEKLFRSDESGDLR